jgi:hypothetical protein
VQTRRTIPVVETALAAVGVVLAWTLAGSQWIRARRDTAGISAAAWSVFAMVNLGWVAYGSAQGAWHLVANGAVAAALNVALLALLTHGRAWIALAAVGSVLGALIGVVWSWTALVVLVTAGAVALRIPQIVRLCTASSVTGVSQLSWTVALVNNLVWAAVWVARGDRVMVVSSLAITAVTVAVFGLVVWRRRNASAVAGSAPAAA